MNASMFQSGLFLKESESMSSVLSNLWWFQSGLCLKESESLGNYACNVQMFQSGLFLKESESYGRILDKKMAIYHIFANIFAWKS